MQLELSLSIANDQDEISGFCGQKERQYDSGSESQRNVSSKELLQLIEMQDYRCALTGRELTPETAHVDHVVPLSRGGSHGIENLQVLHADVNTAKSTLTQDEFLAMCRDVVAWQDKKGMELSE